MAKQTGDSESDLPQKRVRIKDAGYSEAPSFAKRRLQLQQVSPRRVHMQQIKSSPSRQAMKTNVVVLKLTRKALSEGI